MASQRLDLRSKLQSEVGSFVSTLGYSGKLTVSAPYYPYDSLDGTEPYPNPDEPGCYVYASGNGQVQKVGKANRYLGNRIWAPIGRRKKAGETGELYPQAETWLKENQPDIAVWAIAVPDEHWWLAAALEGFLTERLMPAKTTRQI